MAPTIKELGHPWSIGFRWAGRVVRMEENRSAFKILTGTPIGKRPLGRPKRRWKDNIKMDFKEIYIYIYIYQYEKLG